MIKVTLTLLVMAVAYFGHAQQSYSFEYQKKEQSDLQGPYVKSHYLGDEIAVQMQLLRESYTYRTETMMTNVQTASIEKPSIYYSVNKLNKHLKKEIKKGNISEQDAKEILGNALKIAINIRYQDTTELEKELWSTKDPVEITELYNDRIELGQ
jgi:hypothetical protein